MSSPHILVVEDEGVVSLDIASRLAAMGYAVAGISTTGEQAIEMVRAHRPDLVLMDIMLGGKKDGITTAMSMRKRFHLPVVFLTAYSEESTLQRARLAAPYGYILKPFSDQELRSAIEMALFTHQNEEEIRQLGKTNGILSQINQCMMDYPARRELFSKTCHLLAQLDDIRSAWIAWSENESSPLILEAAAGEAPAAECIGSVVQLPVAGTPASSPSFTANGQAFYFVNHSDSGTDQKTGPCGVFPVFFQKRAAAILGVSAREPDYFNDKEIAFLQNVASHLALSLDRLHMELHRRQAEQQLAQINQMLEQRVTERTAELEAANRELEAYSASISHDLRSPLHGINGWSQALIEDCQDSISPQALEYIQNIQAETHRMGNMIDDLMKLSRIACGELERCEVDLALLAREVIQRLQTSPAARKIEIVIQSPLTAQCDHRLMEIALTNLLSNAWKFTQHTDSPKIEVGTLLQEGKTVYYVRDNGAGFNMQYAGKLFRPFQRLHAKNDFTGTGIGLATVQRVIHRHGGRIWAEAKPNQGACFFFTLK